MIYKLNINIMEKIAIQGHSTRGKDVIKILESLGGDNLHNFSGEIEDCYYFINVVKRIDLCSKKNKPMTLSYHVFYTLEEFEQQILNNMENKRTIQIDLTTAKEWYKQDGDLKEIALQAFSKEELQSLPKSWEEYCEIFPVITPDKEYIIFNGQTEVVETKNLPRKLNLNVLPSKKRAKQFLTLNKLLQIRDYYNNGWEPDWDNDNEPKFVITGERHGFGLYIFYNTPTLFPFKTKELRNEFLQNFREDLKLIKEFL